VQKVSTLYVEGLRDAKREPGRAIPSSEQQRLSKRLAPPSSGKREVIRVIHPDWMAGALLLILPVFIGGIYTQQRPLFWPTLGFLAVVAALYAWQRKRLIQRFENGRRIQKEEFTRIEKAVQRWMRLYYCPTCDVVFDPARRQTIPADQLHYHLMQQ
jgi:hypothetical protein